LFLFLKWLSASLRLAVQPGAGCRWNSPAGSLREADAPDFAVAVNYGRYAQHTVMNRIGVGGSENRMKTGFAA